MLHTQVYSLPEVKVFAETILLSNIVIRLATFNTPFLISSRTGKRVANRYARYNRYTLLCHDKGHHRFGPPLLILYS